MNIGLPKEIKDNEYRVGLVPSGVKALVGAGHEVMVEAGAGLGSGIADDEYVRAGAKILSSADEVWAQAAMNVKVKEPVGPEYDRMREGQILYTYLHLAPDPKLTAQLVKKKVTGVAYETITGRGGSLPLLAPMSEVAGRLAVQVGAYYLMKPVGGRGVLLGGVPGVPPGDVAIIGGGIVGLNAAKMAIGLGAHVTVLESSVDRMRYIDDIFAGRVMTVASNEHNIAEACRQADVVVGAVLVTGRSAPKLVTRAMIGEMRKGSVLVDVAVDQGGCFETTKATTHSNPTFEVDGVVHYCVANMPGAVPRTSTFALTNVTLPFALELAGHGFADAVKKNSDLRNGVNTHAGKITYRGVADSQGAEFTELESIL